MEALWLYEFEICMAFPGDEIRAYAAGLLLVNVRAEVAAHERSLVGRAGRGRRRGLRVRARGAVHCGTSCEQPARSAVPLLVGIGSG